MGGTGGCVAGCVQDIDGHVYETVTIGSQVWMKQNLATTRLNDGTPIPLVEDNTAWISSSSPAYCYFKNNSAFAPKYGVLYNWYAVETGKLCPAGWHAPSDPEWLILITGLGGKDVAGGKLKEAGTAHWMPPNTGATNETGFTALPAGDRIGADGSFHNFGGYAIFWSTTPTSNLQAINRVLVFDQADFRIGYDNKTAGFSVRCLAN